MALFSEDGAIIAASNGSEIWLSRTILEQLADRSFSSPTADVFFLPPFVDPVQGAELVPVVAVAGEVTAVGAFSTTSLARRALADIFGGNDQAAAYMVTPGGDILYQIGTFPWADTPVLEHPGVADALRGEGGTTYLTVGGEEYVIAFSPITPVGWGLVIEEPWRAVTDPLLRATELAP